MKLRAPEVKDEYADGWSWLAERHRADTRQIDEHLKSLQEELHKFQVYGSPWKLDMDDPKTSGAEGCEARWSRGAAGDCHDKDFKPLPFLRDDAKIAKTWSDLSELTREKPEQRSWHLLANRERKQFSDIKPERRWRSGKRC